LSTMAATSVTTRIDALQALLRSAQNLTETLVGDGAINRAVRALASLPPDDRDVLARALERGAAWRRLNESTTEITGVRLHANPRPRLFVRSLGPEARTAAEDVIEDDEDILPGTLRLMRRVHLLQSPAAEALWKSVVIRAFGMLSTEERAACSHFSRVVLEVVMQAEAEAGDAGPSVDDGAQRGAR
jgi:hypothetical protein